MPLTLRHLLASAVLLAATQAPAAAAPPSSFSMGPSEELSKPLPHRRSTPQRVPRRGTASPATASPARGNSIPGTASQVHPAAPPP